MEGYFPVKLKRKDLDEVNDDFCDFSLSSPARKIRRLDAELPPIIEEEEMVNPVVFEQSEPSNDTFVDEIMKSNPISIDEFSGNLPINEERAIVLYDPMNNMPSLQSRSPFSVSVNSDFLSGFKNPVLWSNRSTLLKSLNRKTENHDANSETNNGNLAVIPWVPPQAQHCTTPEVSEMMEADDMEIEDNIDNNNNNSQQIPEEEFGSVNGNELLNQWKQHCMIPQPPSNLSTPISWSGTGV